MVLFTHTAISGNFQKNVQANSACTKGGFYKQWEICLILTTGGGASTLSVRNWGALKWHAATTHRMKESRRSLTQFALFSAWLHHPTERIRGDSSLHKFGDLLRLPSFGLLLDFSWLSEMVSQVFFFFFFFCIDRGLLHGFLGCALCFNTHMASSRRYNFTLNYLTVAARPVHAKWQVNNKRGCSSVTRGRASPLIDPQIRPQPINNEDSVSPGVAVTSCARALRVCCEARRERVCHATRGSTIPRSPLHCV